ncbi:MAG TPA: thioesterase family protein [Polyangiaceae bacterium]|jgi:acyl-CoA thioesterase|nr:thioesterase family protein [Polyangiaceae bacterium]
MLYSELLDALVLRDGAGSITIPADWMQGRSVFGGLQSALALRAMRSLVPGEVPLRALQTTFVAPVSGTVNLEARVLRTGKSATHAEARILDGGQTLAIVIGIFGRARASKVEVVAHAPPFTPNETPLDMPRGLGPVFLQHFSMRWLTGAPPYSGLRHATRAVFEIGMNDAVPANEAHVVAMGDVIPPLALTMLSEPAPGSSVTWTLEFLVDHFDAVPLEGWRIHGELRAGRDGYTSQSAIVCAPAGHAVALSQQTMMVFG